MCTEHILFHVICVRDAFINFQNVIELIRICCWNQLYGGRRVPVDFSVSSRVCVCLVFARKFTIISVFLDDRRHSIRERRVEWNALRPRNIWNMHHYLLLSNYTLACSIWACACVNRKFYSLFFSVFAPRACRSLRRVVRLPRRCVVSHFLFCYSFSVLSWQTYVTIHNTYWFNKHVYEEMNARGFCFHSFFSVFIVWNGDGSRNIVGSTTMWLYHFGIPIRTPHICRISIFTIMKIHFQKNLRL